MIFFRLLPVMCLVSATFATSIPLCRQSPQGENFLGNEICLCSSGSPSIVDSLDTLNVGIERLVLFVYKKPSGETVMFIPKREYQHLIPDFPENYGIVQDISNIPSIVETFENSPSKDIRHRKPVPYPSDKYPDRENVGPNEIWQKPEKEREKPKWQIPVPSDQNLPGPNNQIPETNEYETPYAPENYDYPTPGGNDYPESESNNYPPPYHSPDPNEYQRPEPNNYQPPYQTPEPNDYLSPTDYQTDEPNIYEPPYNTPESNNDQPHYYTPDTNNYQTPHHIPQPNDYPPSYHLPQPNDYPSPIDTNGYQTDELPYYPPESIDYQQTEPKNYEPPYHTPDSNNNLPPYQIPESTNHQPPYYTPDTNGDQIPEPSNYPLPYHTPGINRYESPETNHDQTPHHTPRPQEYQTPDYPPGNDDYESPENNNNQPPHKPGYNDNKIPQTPHYIPSVTNNNDNPVVSPNSRPNSEEQYYPERASNEVVPSDITEPNQSHAQPMRPNNNYPESNEDDRDVQPTKIPKDKRIRVPIKDNNGKIIGWKPSAPKNDWIKDEPQFIEKEPDLEIIPSFDLWLKQQLRITTLSGNRIPTSTSDIIALHKAIRNVLLQNGFVISNQGTILDGYGKVISLTNLKLRPIYIGKSVSYDHFIKQTTVNKVPKDAPFLEGLLLTMLKPAKILGIVPLKITSLPSTYKFDGNRGKKNIISGNKLYSEGPHETSFKILPLEHLVSFRKGSSDSKKRGSKSKSRKIGHMKKSRDSAFLKQALAKISKPGEMRKPPRDRDLEKPDVSEEKPDFRIIGGISATVSGTPLLFKGRSGREYWNNIGY